VKIEGFLSVLFCILLMACLLAGLDALERRLRPSLPSAQGSPSS